MQSRLVSDRAESVAPSATTATNTELRAGGEASSADPVPEHHRPLPWGTAPEETASAIRGQQVGLRTTKAFCELGSGTLHTRVGACLCVS